MRCYRKVLNITWKDKIRNEDVLLRICYCKFKPKRILAPITATETSPKNGVIALSKNCFEIKTRFFFFFFFFLSKSSKFRVVWTVQFCSNFTSMWSKYLSNNVWRDFRLPMSALASVAGKSFNVKFPAKFDFPIGYFILLMLRLEV